MSIPKKLCGICCLLYVFLTPTFNFGQERVIKGKVQNLNNDVANVLVVNLNSRQSTITDSLGLFHIKAKLKDSIRFTAVQYLTKEIIITDKMLLKNLLTVNLIENVINLNEVTVTPYNLIGKIDRDIKKLDVKPTVTSSSLGLPNANIYVMTQSERLLFEADRGKYIYFYGMAMVINTHKIMNRVSGRTKSLKERVNRDENMELIREIITKFSKKTISESFNIPEVNLDGFFTYCLSQKDFSELSQSGNIMEIWEYLKGKSVNFKEKGLTKE